MKGLFGGLFDFNHDGNMSAFERAAEFSFLHEMLNEDNDLRPGDMINHDKYGFGVVVTIDGSIATISFKKDGLKKLMKNHKSIHKI